MPSTDQLITQLDRVATTGDVGHGATLPLEIRQPLHAFVAPGFVERVRGVLEPRDFRLERIGAPGCGAPLEVRQRDR